MATTGSWLQPPRRPGRARFRPAARRAPGRAAALLGLLGLLGALGAAAAGCSSSPAARSEPGGATAAADDPGPRQGQPDARSSWSTLCAARPGRSLQADLQRVVPESLRAKVIPLGMTATGHAAYVSIWTPRFAGVAELNLGTGRVRRIQSFGNRVTDQADGSSDGGWLVWEETYSLQSLDRFTVYAWNPGTGPGAQAGAVTGRAGRRALAEPLAPAGGQRSLRGVGPGLRPGREGRDPAG